MTTFDETIAAILADCPVGTRGVVHHAGDDEEARGGAYQTVSLADVRAGRATESGDRATVFPCGFHGGSIIVEACASGELCLGASRQGPLTPPEDDEKGWHLTEPTEPDCIGQPVYALADALRDAAEFIGWTRAKGTP